MKRFWQFKTKFLMLFLISGILVLSISFIFISCGSGPMLKVLNTNKGPFAIDLSLAPDDTSGVCGEEGQPACLGNISVVNSNLPSIANKEFTVEAWVKSKTTNLSGGIFARYDSKGFVMWVKDNKPKFGIRYLTLQNSVTTSTDYFVDSGSNISDERWHHIAGVLVNKDHSGISDHPDCPDGEDNPTGGKAEKPHLDIYIDGIIKNCATTYEYGKLDPDGNPIIEPQFASDPPDTFDILTIGRLPGGGGSPVLCIDPTSNPVPTVLCIDSTSLHKETRFDGVIDEVRFWTVARKPAEILACKDQMLGVAGDCKIDPFILKGYWPFNAGKGTSITDASGSGFAGSIRPPGTFWDGGWVAGDWP